MALRITIPEESVAKSHSKVSAAQRTCKELVSGDSCCLQVTSCIFHLFFLEFHYRYNSPGQNYLNPNERSAFVKLCFLNDNKNSSPCKYICCMISSL